MRSVNARRPYPRQAQPWWTPLPQPHSHHPYPRERPGPARPSHRPAGHHPRRPHPRGLTVCSGNGRIGGATVPHQNPRRSPPAPGTPPPRTPPAPPHHPHRPLRHCRPRQGTPLATADRRTVRPRPTPRHPRHRHTGPNCSPPYRPPARSTPGRSPGGVNPFDRATTKAVHAYATQPAPRPRVPPVAHPPQQAGQPFRHRTLVPPPRPGPCPRPADARPSTLPSPSPPRGGCNVHGPAGSSPPCGAALTPTETLSELLSVTTIGGRETAAPPATTRPTPLTHC